MCPRLSPNSLFNFSQLKFFAPIVLHLYCFVGAASKLFPMLFYVYVTLIRRPSIVDRLNVSFGLYVHQFITSFDTFYFKHNKHTHKYYYTPITYFNCISYTRKILNACKFLSLFHCNWNCFFFHSSPHYWHFADKFTCVCFMVFVRSFAHQPTMLQFSIFLRCRRPFGMS